MLIVAFSTEANRQIVSVAAPVNAGEFTPLKPAPCQVCVTSGFRSPSNLNRRSRAARKQTGSTAS